MDDPPTFILTEANHYCVYSHKLGINGLTALVLDGCPKTAWKDVPNAKGFWETILYTLQVYANYCINTIRKLGFGNLPSEVNLLIFIFLLVLPMIFANVCILLLQNWGKSRPKRGFVRLDREEIEEDCESKKSKEESKSESCS